MRLYVLGALNIDYVYQVDHILREGETLSSSALQQFPGGKGLNQAVALAKAGAQVVLGGIIGKEGTFLLEFLKKNCVDVSRVKQLDYPSGHAMIQVDRQGQNSILLFPGTNRMIDRDYILWFLRDAQKEDVLLLQNEISALDEAFAAAAEKEMQIAFNPSPYDEIIQALPLQHVKWWFCNEIEGAALFGGNQEKITQVFQQQYPDGNLVLTLGEGGSVFQNASVSHSQPIYKVPVVDTTAAGDTFTGYFLAAMTRGETIAAAMDAAAKASAITVSRAGAAASIPDYRELTEFKNYS